MKKILILIVVFLSSCIKENNKSNDIENNDPKSRLKGVWIETFPNDSGSIFYIGRDTISGYINDINRNQYCKAFYYELQNNNVLYSIIENPVSSDEKIDYYTEIVFYKTDSIRIIKYIKTETNPTSPSQFEDIVLKKIK